MITLTNTVKKSIYTYAALALVILGVFLLGSWYGRSNADKSKDSKGRRILYYVDPMNPTHTSPEPGLAPCGMKMEPVYSEAGGQVADSAMPPGSVNITPQKQQIIGVRVATVEKRPWSYTLRTLGRVAVDETKIYRINLVGGGFVRQVYANSTGSLVKKDEPLATYYNSELFAEQSRFITSLDVLESFSPMTVANKPQTVETILKNLETLGMGQAQLEELIRTRKPILEITLRAPATSFILARNVSPGLQFQRGFELYKLADLSRVWIVADLFGNESQFVRPQENAKVTLPDQQKAFQATVSNVLPQVDPASRALKVRLEVDNPEYALRPDMFVDVEFPINLPPAITVPRDAVLDSGLQKTVFVDRGKGFFEPRRVETGQRFGEQVEIVQGLKDGERIVISGNFLIDSESRMRLAAAGMFGEVSKDPVCGLNVDESKAKSAGFQTAYKNLTYNFCSEGCKQHFDKNPERYALKPGEAPGTFRRVTTDQAHAEEIRPKDPVCGMEVDQDKAKAAGWVSEYQGKTYFFCSGQCKQDFDKEPQRYVSKGGEAPTAAGSPEAGKGQTVSVPTSKDPVCSAEVDEEKARAAGRISEYQGKTYFFDSDVCKLVFNTDPGKYAAKGPGPKQPAAPAPDIKGTAIPWGMVKDPVCGKLLFEGKAKQAVKKSEFKGKTYFFDSDECKQTFDKEPERYVSAQTEPAPVFKTQGLPMGMFQDPACGSAVTKTPAKDFGLVSEHRGMTYYFDSIECKEAFDKEPDRYVGKGARTQKKYSGKKTLPAGLAKDPVSGLNVDESKAKADGWVSEYQGKTYYFFSYYFKRSFDETPERFASKPAGAAQEAVSPAGEPKAAAGTARSKDPVCGADVDESQAKAAGWVSVYQGKAYYFHSYQCNRQFDKDPAKYVGKTAGKDDQKQ